MTKNEQQKELYPWRDVEKARNNPRRRIKMSLAGVQLMGGKGLSCPCCGCSYEKLTWFEFSSPPWTWQNLCGVRGLMSVCDHCHVQVEFIRQMVN